MTTVKDTKPTVEELMKPRYIIQNEWFECPYPNGTILVPQSHSNGFGPETWIAGQYTFLESDLKKYTYLVRKLHWAEHRTPEEMPEYVKNEYDGICFKARYRKDGEHSYWAETMTKGTGWFPHRIIDLLPITEQEYLSYTSPTRSGD